MRAHFAAFKKLLEEPSMLTGKVYPTIRRTSGDMIRSNYVVAFPDVPDLDDNRYAGRQGRDSKALYRFDVRVVAVDGDGLMILSDAVLEVIGKTPVVAGRRCDPVSLVPSVEEGRGQYDQTTDLYSLDMTFEFDSRRA